MQLCSIRLALLVQLHVHSIKMFLILAGMSLLHIELVSGSRLLGASFGALWIRTVVMSTGAVSSVVWLGWVVGTCGVRILLSLLLRCLVVVTCNPTSVLFRSIVPLSSLGLPNIFLEC